jgi:hypothetical protein
MKFIAFGVFIFALTFCGITDRVKQGIEKISSPSNYNTASNSSNSNSATSSAGDKSAEIPVLTSEQKATLEGGQETEWSDQGMSWSLPKGWKKMNQTKEMFNYSSPDNAFLIATISTLPDNFPVEVSLKATYESSLQQLKNGKYENARYVEIDGVKGVEFIETMPESKDDPRRHQWIAFRNYQGKTQQLNIMLSTKGNNFEKHRNDFPAVLYSMKIQK